MAEEDDIRFLYFARLSTPTPDCSLLLDSVFDLTMRKGRPFSSFSRSVSFMLLLAACIASHLSYSQKIANVDFEAIGSTIKISYDIEGCSGEEDYDIKLSLGKDEKLMEITRGLSGDIKDVSCGTSRVILWDVFSDRGELSGQIYFAVEIHRTHEKIQEPQTIREEIHEAEKIDDGKSWRSRSWKADKGYVGGSFGVFTPYRRNSSAPYNPKQNGYFLNTTIGYLPSLVFGISTTIYLYGAPSVEKFQIASWTSCGVMIGPLISFPIGNKVKWEFRPQVGYSVIFPSSQLSEFDSLSSARSGVAYNIGTGLRMNFGKRTCYLVNVEYLSASRKFEDYQIVPDIGLLSVSMGVAFRFY